MNEGVVRLKREAIGEEEKNVDLAVEEAVRVLFRGRDGRIRKDGEYVEENDTGDEGEGGR